MSLAREMRAKTAKETLAIIEKGGYHNREGEWNNLSSDVSRCVKHTRLYTPQELEEIVEGFSSKPLTKQARKNDEKGLSSEDVDQLQVTTESTLAAAQRLRKQGYDPACLNFASAKNPGGGFLKGSSAQEESIARASALYTSISEQDQYYKANKQYSSALYTDYMIYSPCVPVFRNDEDELLDQPFTTAVITAPAVNAGVIYKKEPESKNKIAETMINRITKILCLASYRGHNAIVLGAYGCGVFKNSPEDVANYFHHCLWGTTPYGQLFDRIVFAVLARKNKSTYFSFKNILQDGSE